MAHIPKKSPGKGQQEFEKLFLERVLVGFKPWESRAWKLLTSLYGPKISKEEVQSLGLVCSDSLHLTLTREYKRRKETMIKWFEDHYDEVEPFLRNQLKVIMKDDIGAEKVGGSDRTVAEEPLADLLLESEPVTQLIKPE